MERGKAVETGLDYFIKNQNKKIVDSLNVAKTFFKSATNFIDDAEENQKQFEMIEPMLLQIINKFTEFWISKDYIGSQIRIETLIYGCPFIGFIDYVLEDEETVYIIDLKTKDKFMLTNDDKLQMAIYKKAYQEKTNKNRC